METDICEFCGLGIERVFPTAPWIHAVNGLTRCYPKQDDFRATPNVPGSENPCGEPGHDRGHWEDEVAGIFWCPDCGTELHVGALLPPKGN